VVARAERAEGVSETDLRRPIDEDRPLLAEEPPAAAVALPAPTGLRAGVGRTWVRIAPMLPVLRVIAFVAAIAIVVVMSVRAFQDVDFGRLTLWPLPVACAFAVGWWVLLARGWALLVTGSARRSDISMWCRTQAIRYLPGGIWAPASRATLLPGTLSDKLSTVGAENVLALCAAVAVGGAALAAGGDFVWLPLVLAPGAALAGAWLVAGWSRVSAPRALRVTGNDLAGFVAYAIAAALVQWAVSGRLDLLTVAGAAAVAWGVGLVVIIAPSGLGVREVTYVALLSGTFSNSEATTAAVTLRLVTIFAELLVLVLLGRPTEDADTPAAAG